MESIQSISLSPTRHPDGENLSASVPADRSMIHTADDSHSLHATIEIESFGPTIILTTNAIHNARGETGTEPVIDVDDRDAA